MAFMRIPIRSLIESPKSKSTFFPFLPLKHTTRSIASNSTPLLTLSRSRFIPQCSGPLLISLPPWKLSSYTTPLFLSGKDVFFPDCLSNDRSSSVLIGGESRKEKKVTVEVENEDGFFNLPNLVSIARGLSGPLIGWMIINEWYLPAFGALAISGASDWLDGYLARRMGINSVYGSYLDPLADKVLIGCVAVAMVRQDLLHPGLVSLVLFRDVGLVAGAVYKRASSLKWKWKSWTDFVNLDAAHREKVEPLFISKLNTVFQLLLVASALLQPEFGTDESLEYLNYLSWLVASTTIASTAAYGVQHFRNRAAYKLRNT